MKKVNGQYLADSYTIQPNECRFLDWWLHVEQHAPWASPIQMCTRGIFQFVRFLGHWFSWYTNAVVQRTLFRPHVGVVCLLGYHQIQSWVDKSIKWN